MNETLLAKAKELMGLLTPEEKEALAILFDTEKPLWAPLPGPQTDALNSQADELFYGGSAGGGKTDLLLGAALTRHHTSIIFRREYPQLKAMVHRSRSLIGKLGHLNAQAFEWRLNDGRLLEFGACAHDYDVVRFQGRPHDLVCFDEVTNFLKDQVIFLAGWCRPAVFDNRYQRCRVIMTGNPPTTPEGRWVVEEFAPWLEQGFKDPAEPGELRWYVREDDRLVWLRNPEPIRLKDGTAVKPRSRTFIPARVDDNPELVKAGYKATLQGLPEPLRSQLLYGDFNIGLQDDPWQVIPTAWVQAAQARWSSEGSREQPQTHLGVDVARGGEDRTILARRHGTWFGPLLKVKGSRTPDGLTVAGLVRSNCDSKHVAVHIDIIIVGAAVYDILRSQGEGVFRPVDFRGKTLARDKSGQLGFANVRAWAYWQLREALDPRFGAGLALPPDPELLADLTSVHWQQSGRGIQIEDKEDVIKRLGRSPDLADAVVLAHFSGNMIYYPEPVRPAHERRGPFDDSRRSSIRHRGWLGLRPQP